MELARTRWKHFFRIATAVVKNMISQGTIHRDRLLCWSLLSFKRYHCSSRLYKILHIDFCIKWGRKLLTFSSTVTTYSSVASFSSMTLLLSVLESLECQRMRTKMAGTDRGIQKKKKKNIFKTCRRKVGGESHHRVTNCTD